MRRPLALGALLLALSGCALPLPHGVQVPGKVTAAQRPQDTLKVLPPGPRADAEPSAVVLGFLGAQSNADGRHAIARQFLSPQLQGTWRDAGAVEVFDPGTLQVRPVHQAGASSVMQVSAMVSGRIRADGSYVPQAPALLRDSYQLRRDSRGRWRLTDVPDGLRLTPADRDRSFRARTVYFLAPSPAGDAPRLVPDQVFLPFEAEPLATMRALVGRLVSGPSQALGTSVRTSVPHGAVVRSVTDTPSGVVTVNLSAPVAGLSGPARQALSAQLVWTLRQLGSSFTGLRLLVEGAPLAVPGEGALQDASDWSAFDPDGLSGEPPVYYVKDERLRSLGVDLPSGPATAGAAADADAVPVDAVAVTPDRTRVALLDRQDSMTTVRVGALRDATFPVVLTGRDLHSPSWGSGVAGLWLLRGGDVLLQPPGGAARQVPVVGGPGPLQSLAVSRDGVRVAVVSRGVLSIGRIQGLGSSRPAIVGLTAVAPQISGVTDVSWQTGTSVVVLGRLQQTFLAVQVAVDGSTTTPFDGPGLPGPPLSVAASPKGVVVTSRARRSDALRLYQVNGQGFRAGPVGSAPAYPG